MKPSKPPFYKQETTDSCVPACLRMILSGFGLDLPESQLRQMCDCTFDGTDALKAVDAARQLGFSKSAKYTLSFDELKAIVADGTYPIVYVDLYPFESKRITHAMIVVEIAADLITVHDPDQGERALHRDLFTQAWRWQHNLAIIVEK